MSIISVTEDDNNIGQLSALTGYWEDSVEIDKMIITANRCPHCKNNLAYQGMSNSTYYKAFGICFGCEFAKLFWTEPSVFRQVKNKILKRAKDKKAA